MFYTNFPLLLYGYSRLLYYYRNRPTTTPTPIDYLLSIIYCMVSLGYIGQLQLCYTLIFHYYCTVVQTVGYYSRATVQVQKLKALLYQESRHRHKKGPEYLGTSFIIKYLVHIIFSLKYLQKKEYFAYRYSETNINTAVGHA